MLGRLAYFKTQYPKVRRLLRDAQRGREIQREVMREKLRIVADSDFGRDHHIGSIKSVDDFRRQLPISDYEYFRPYLPMAETAEVNLTPDPARVNCIFLVTLDQLLYEHKCTRLICSNDMNILLMKTTGNSITSCGT